MRATGWRPEQPPSAAQDRFPAEHAAGISVSEPPPRRRAQAAAARLSGRLVASEPAGAAPETVAIAPSAGSTAATLAAEHRPELTWLLLAVGCGVAFALFPTWQVIPFDLIWISLALLYSYRLWPNRRALALTATALAATAACIADDIIRHLRVSETVEQIPLLATLFVMLAWHAHRRSVAGERAEMAAEANRLLSAQRRFLQDASHQLRTPITIALGHAELLARQLAGNPDARDIHVVVGELERLRTLSDRLLLVAASENPDFLAIRPAELDTLAADVLRRWRPTADRNWRLGQLEPVVAPVDAERPALAMDALVENAVRHTPPGGLIEISVVRGDDRSLVRLVVEDGGEGISSADLPYIFDRFRTVSAGSSRGTGLGLALVRAIARGHGGDVAAWSLPGQGSRFEVLIPVPAEPVRPEPVLDWSAALGLADDRRLADAGFRLPASGSAPEGTDRTGPPPGRVQRQNGIS